MSGGKKIMINVMLLTFLFLFQICECISDREGEGRVVCYECIVEGFDLVRYNWNKYSELV